MATTGPPQPSEPAASAGPAGEPGRAAGRAADRAAGQAADRAADRAGGRSGRAPAPHDSLEAATAATRSLRGLPAELTARVPRLLEAMRSVGAGLDLAVTLDRLVCTTTELVDARYAAIGVLDGASGRFADFVSYGVGAEDCEPLGAAREHGLPSALAVQPDPVPLADLTTDPQAAGYPAGRPPVRSFLGVPLRVQDEDFGALYLAEKQGDGPFTETDLQLVRVLAVEAALAIANARRDEQARQRERWIDGSVAVTTALLSANDAEDALVVVAEKARRLADSTAGIVLLPTAAGGLEIVAVDADEPEGLLGTVVEPHAPIVPQLMCGEPVFVEDSATDPRMTTGISRRFGPSMMLPLRSGSRVLGILSTPRSRGARPFTATERRLATQFAAQAALALVLADAQRDRERLAVYEDRDRIARDLHDLVIQRLFATGMMLEGAQRKAELPLVQDKIGKAVDELDATIQEVRTAIFALEQGPAEAPSGLRTRVLREIGTAAVPLGFQPSATFVGAVDARVGELTGKNLIAALREALSNAFRHARASRIEVVVDATVRLPDGRDGVRLTVADDGVGIAAGGRRSGLRNLARRAEALGGSSGYGPGLAPAGGSGAGADVAASDDHGGGRGGTTVTWEAPL
ncbi:GAF domain-containing sensor histidine kinase [Streptomyces sp. 796.1]|uniref:sensor histidine kinase n=1 Tax=Streptomyces sp. 796.1 TaxID=3163029 RepID=UPI0039C9DAF1